MKGLLVLKVRRGAKMVSYDYKRVLSHILLVCIFTTSIGYLSTYGPIDMMESVEGADVGFKPIVGITDYPGSPISEDGAELTGIAWHPKGTIALAVGIVSGIGVAYRYDRSSANWTSINHGSGVELHGVTWFQHMNTFIVVGDGRNDNPSIFTTDGYNPLLEFPMIFHHQNRVFYDVVCNGQDSLLMVGESVSMYRGGNLISIGVDNNHDYYGVAYSNHFYYFVGASSSNGIFCSIHLSGSNAGTIPPPDHMYGGSGGIWSTPLYGIDAHGTDIIVVGEDVIEVYDTYSQTYIDEPVQGLDQPGEILKGVTWIAESRSAYIVGQRGLYDGLVYQYRWDIHRASRVPGSLEMGRQNAIACMEIPPFMMMSVGLNASDSAWQISQTSGFSDIIVNTYLPHILYVDMREMGHHDGVLGRQIDVNSAGREDRVYELTVLVRHNVPDILHRVEFSAWFAGHNTGMSSHYPLEDENNRTTAFRVEWNRFGDNFIWLWPTLDGDQQEIIPGEHTYIDESVAGDYDQFNITFRFVPGPQMRFANGIDGTFIENGAPYSKDSALLTPNTWDIGVKAQDIEGGQNTTFHEFGVYRFLSLSIQGIPGSYTTSGAPGMTDVFLVPGGDTYINYSSNCFHAIKVYAESNLTGVDTGVMIPASNLYVQGGFREKIVLSTSGEAGAVYLIGDPVQDEWVTPRRRYNYTTTFINTLNEGQTPYPAIQWWIDIPGVPEDSYRTNLIYVLEHDD